MLPALAPALGGGRAAGARSRSPCAAAARARARSRARRRGPAASAGSGPLRGRRERPVGGPGVAEAGGQLPLRPAWRRGRRSSPRRGRTPPPDPRPPRPGRARGCPVQAPAQQHAARVQAVDRRRHDRRAIGRLRRPARWTPPSRAAVDRRTSWRCPWRILRPRSPRAPGRPMPGRAAAAASSRCGRSSGGRPGPVGAGARGGGPRLRTGDLRRSRTTGIGTCRPRASRGGADKRRRRALAVPRVLRHARGDHRVELARQAWIALGRSRRRLGQVRVQQKDEGAHTGRRGRPSGTRRASTSVSRRCSPAPGASPRISSGDR